MYNTVDTIFIFINSTFYLTYDVLYCILYRIIPHKEKILELTKTFNDLNVRVILNNNEPFFAAADVCKVLDIKNSRQALSYLDKDDVISSDAIDSMKRPQVMNYINEGGLYQLIFRSRKNVAKEFKKWVTHEVLPSIRKTGKYSIPEKLKIKSKEARNSMTAEWKKHKVEKPAEYRELTLQEYESLDFESWKRKKDFTEDELKLITALELMEQLKLTNIPNIKGFLDCKESIKDTAGSIKQIVNNKEVE